MGANLKLGLVVFGIVFVVVVSFVIYRQFMPSDTGTGNFSNESLEQAPVFALKDYSGNTVSLSDFKGKPVVVNAWAAWCPFCTKELPDFVSVKKEFGEDVVFVAINRQESLSVARGYTDGLGISDDMVYLLDPTDFFYRSIGGFTMPETLFIDSDGNILFHKRGPMERDEIIDRAKILLR